MALLEGYVLTTLTHWLFLTESLQRAQFLVGRGKLLYINEFRNNAMSKYDRGHTIRTGTDASRRLWVAMLVTVFEAEEGGLKIELLPRTVHATVKESKRQSLLLNWPLIFEPVLPYPDDLVSQKVLAMALASNMAAIPLLRWKSWAVRIEN